MLLRTCDLGEHTHLLKQVDGGSNAAPSATRFSALRQGTFKSTGLKSESDTRTRDMACIQDFHRCQASTELSLSNASVARGPVVTRLTPVLRGHVYRRAAASIGLARIFRPNKPQEDAFAAQAVE